MSGMSNKTVWEAMKAFRRGEILSWAAFKRWSRRSRETYLTELYTLTGSMHNHHHLHCIKNICIYILNSIYFPLAKLKAV